MTASSLTLTAPGQSLEVVPEAGGSLAAWRWETGGGTVDLLRVGHPAAVAAGGAGGLSCFPLVPYSNRIRRGRFTFEGREIALPLNFGDHPHSIHGQGWQAAWRVAEQDAGRVVLDYQHAADAWPFAYAARQTIALRPDGLEIALDLTNRSEEAMPAGAGLHPYFAGARAARLTAGVAGVWQVDDEVMPTAHTALPERWDLPRGRAVSELACDNVFTGWDGRARIERPDVGLVLELEAARPLRFLVVYAPVGEDFFCVEPVSHATDAFNRAAAGDPDTGMRVLAPGETLSAALSIAVTAL